MVSLKGWIDKARRVAADRLPPEVTDAGRRVRDRVVESAPAPIADIISRVLPVSETGVDRPPDTPEIVSAEPASATQPTSDATASAAQPASAAGSVSTTPSTVAPESQPTRREDVLDRVRTKADKGLKPEDRLVVIYATQEEAETVTEIRAQLRNVETTIREFDLAKEPQTRKQIAELSGVMVPPYVFINGRYWGSLYEITALAETGDLEKVVANRLDELGDEARRIGKVHESYSDELSVENIVARWKAGHILCVDDLDSWYEIDRDGTERFFYQGGPRSVDEMPQIAREIAQGVEREEVEVSWLLDPAVQLH
jgi:glutaredoxin